FAFIGRIGRINSRMLVATMWAPLSPEPGAELGRRNSLALSELFRKSKSRMTQTSIETPELIGCMNLDRFFAAQIDTLPAIIVALVAGSKFGSFGPAISWTAAIVAYLGYFLLSETLFGNTFGKWSMGLRIRTLSGEKCTVRQALIRSLLRLVEVNPLILGGLPAGAA